MKKIFLIGYMGCGKSTLGRKLAKIADMEFMDMDSIIEQREGASISDIFYYQGEEYFRNAERRALEQTAEFEDAIIFKVALMVEKYVDYKHSGKPLSSDNSQK